MSSGLMSAARFGDGAPDSTACPRVALLIGTPSRMMTGWLVPNVLGPRIWIAVEAPASPLPWFVSTLGTLPANA